MNIAGPHEKFFAAWPQDLALWRNIYPNMEDFQSFGTLDFLLAAIGVGVVWWRRPDLRGWAALLGGLTAVTLFLQWPASHFFWDTFPFFTMINFSSRLMAPAIVFVAPLVGGLVLNKPSAVEPVRSGSGSGSGRWHNLLAIKWRLAGAVGLAAIMVYACLSGLSYVYWPLKFDGFISHKALTEQVYRSDVTYLPRGLTDYRQIDGYFPPAFNDGRPATSGDSLSWVSTGPDSFELQAILTKPGLVTVPLLWFTDNWWSVTDQNGRHYSTIDNPLGHRMALTLNAGQFTLRVKFVDPPLRTICNFVSLVSLMVVITWLLISLLQRKKLVVTKPGDIDSILGESPVRLGLNMKS